MVDLCESPPKITQNLQSGWAPSTVTCKKSSLILVRIRSDKFNGVPSESSPLTLWAEMRRCRPRNSTQWESFFDFVEIRIVTSTTKVCGRPTIWSYSRWMAPDLYHSALSNEDDSLDCVCWLINQPWQGGGVLTFVTFWIVKKFLELAPTREIFFATRVLSSRGGSSFYFVDRPALLIVQRYLFFDSLSKHRA